MMPPLHDCAWSKAIVGAVNTLIFCDVYGIFSRRFFLRWLLHNRFFYWYFFGDWLLLDSIGIFCSLGLLPGKQPFHGFGWGKHFSAVLNDFVFAFVLFDKFLDSAIRQRPGRVICFEFFSYFRYNNWAVVLTNNEDKTNQKRMNRIRVVQARISQHW